MAIDQDNQINNGGGTVQEAGKGMFFSKLASTSASVKAGLLALSIGVASPAIASDQEPKIQLVQAGPTNTVRTVSLGGQSFDEVMAKDGGYAGIVREFLGTTDPQIIAFIKREGDKYIATLSETERNKGMRDFRSNLASMFGRAKGLDKPNDASVNFFVTNAKQILIEFARYPDQYPNLAELGKWQISQIRAIEAQRRGDEAQRRAEEERRKTERLRSIANGTRS